MSYSLNDAATIHWLTLQNFLIVRARSN